MHDLDIIYSDNQYKSKWVSSNIEIMIRPMDVGYCIFV